MDFVDSQSMMPVSWPNLRGVKFSQVQVPPTTVADDTRTAIVNIFHATTVIPDTTQLVIRGTYESGSPDSDDPFVSKPAVCKMAWKGPDGGDRETLTALRKEARFYCNQLRDVQGDIVPRFYGLYQAAAWDLEEPEDAAVVLCLILEDDGDPVAEEVAERDFDVLSQIIAKFIRLHKEIHLTLPDDSLDGCLVWHPVSREIRIVGFGGAEEHKGCSWTDPPCYELDMYGSWALYGCKDLYHVSTRFSWLTPGMICVDGVDFNSTHYASTTEMIQSPRYRHYDPNFGIKLVRAVEKYNERFGRRKEVIEKMYRRSDKSLLHWPPRVEPLLTGTLDINIAGNTQGNDLKD